MISFDDFIKQDDEEKYNNMQRDLLAIQRRNKEIEIKNKIIEIQNHVINKIRIYLLNRSHDNGDCSVCSVMTYDLLEILKEVMIGV